MTHYTLFFQKLLDKIGSGITKKILRWNCLFINLKSSSFQVEEHWTENTLSWVYSTVTTSKSRSFSMEPLQNPQNRKDWTHSLKKLCFKAITFKKFVVEIWKHFCKKISQFFSKKGFRVCLSLNNFFLSSLFKKNKNVLYIHIKQELVCLTKYTFHKILNYQKYAFYLIMPYIYRF